MSQSGAIADGGTPGTLEISGGGRLVLTNTANSYSGGTVVIDDSTISIDDDHELGAATGGLTLGDGTSSGQLALTDFARLEPGDHPGGRRRHDRP